MTCNERNLYHYIKQSLESRASMLALSDDVVYDDFIRIYKLVLEENPQLFWYSLRNMPKNNGDIIIPIYLGNDSDLFHCINDFRKVLKNEFNIEYVSELSPFKQVSYVYKWLIERTKIKKDDDVKYPYYCTENVLDVIVSGHADSFGMAKTVKYICQKLDIPCFVLTGELEVGGQFLAHAWNCVFLPNEGWCTVDAFLGHPDARDVISKWPWIEVSEQQLCEARYLYNDEGMRHIWHNTHPIELDKEIHLCHKEHFGDDLIRKERRIEELQYEIDRLQSELEEGNWNIERLQSELEKEERENRNLRFEVYSLKRLQEDFAYGRSGEEFTSMPESVPCEREDESPKFNSAPNEGKSSEPYVEETQPYSPDCNARPKSPRRGLFDWLFKRNKAQKTKYVNTCVYAPGEARRGSDILVQMYLYYDEDRDKVVVRALKADKNAVEKEVEVLTLPLNEGDKLRVHFSAKGCKVDEPDQEIVWRNMMESRKFILTIPANFADTQVIGTMSIFRNQGPMAKMKFTIQIVGMPRNIYANVIGNMFKRVFVSYSHQDTESVEPFVRSMKENNVDFFYDRNTLPTAVNWRERIAEWMQVTDLFVLFWSENSAASVEVGKEIDLALERKRSDNSKIHIAPLNIEPIATLPEKLSGIQCGEIN